MVRRAESEPDRHAVGPALQRRRVADRERDLRVEALPHARHRHHDRGLQLAEVLRDRVHALGEIGGHSVADAGIGEDALGGMAQRQERKTFVVGRHGQQRPQALALLDDVAVAQHGALGRPRRARGVDQDREIVRGDGRGSRVPQVRVPSLRGAAELEQGVHADHRLVGEVVEMAHVEDDDLAEARHVGANGKRLVELFVVFHEQELRRAMVDDIGHLLRRVGRVDARADAADPERSEIDVQPLRVVAAQHADPVAGFQAERGEPQAGKSRPFLEVSPRHRPPDSQRLLAQGDGVPPERGSMPEHRRHRLAGGRLSRVRYRHFFFRFHRCSPRTPAFFMPR